MRAHNSACMRSNIRSCCFALLVVVAAAVADAELDQLAATCQAMLRPNFVLFGDSITQRGFETQGWTANLANAYIRKVCSRCLCGAGPLGLVKG